MADKVSKDRSPLVGIEDFADNGINIGIRFWAPTSHYFETLYGANAAIHTALQNANISFSLPQREIRMLGDQQINEA